jgi:hypothetical protein
MLLGYEKVFTDKQPEYEQFSDQVPLWYVAACIQRDELLLENVAIIGLRKQKVERTASRTKHELLTVAHAVSAVYLNLKKLKGIEYDPTLSVAEDISFNRAASAKGLLVCNYNAFVATKAEGMHGGNEAFHYNNWGNQTLLDNCETIGGNG